MNIDESGGIYFNNQKLSDDLDGTLSGSVMFAQTCIIPSQPATDEKDIRPHLVQERDTLVLFKPFDEHFNPDVGVEMSVFDQKNTLVYEQPMLTPDQLPDIAERLGHYGDEWVFLEPESYDIIIYGNTDFDGKIDIFKRNGFSFPK